MNIQEQFCTKEQSLRLVELGVKPVALFYHMKAKDGPHGEYIQYGWSSEAIAPAYNVAELGDMLPLMYSTCRFIGQPGWLPTDEGEAFYEAAPNDENLALVKCTEAQARANLLICLINTGRAVIPEQWRQDSNDPCADGRCKLSYSKDHEEIKPLPEVEAGEENGKVFTAVWKALKGSTIQMPAYYRGYQEVNGRHVKLIIDAIKEAK